MVAKEYFCFSPEFFYLCQVAGRIALQDIEKVDLGPLIMDYLQIVNSWDGRKETMDLAIN